MVNVFMCVFILLLGKGPIEGFVSFVKVIKIDDRVMSFNHFREQSVLLSLFISSSGAKVPVATPSRFPFFRMIGGSNKTAAERGKSKLLVLL